MDSVNPVIALSTSFLQSRYPEDGYAMMSRAAELGYEYVELGHSVPIVAVDGILRALNEGIVKVSSLHNFCPVPPFASGAVPNLFSPSTKSAAESQQWRRHTNNTLDFAKQTGARAVVSHSGSLSYFLFPPKRVVEKFYKTDKLSEFSETSEFVRARDRFETKTAARAFKKDYTFLLENLSAIEENLCAADVFLGVENREGTDELPLDWTFSRLFEKLAARPRIKAWHDIGHSKIKELKGLYSQQKLIEETLENIGGWHLHDCTADGRDHIAIGAGCIDFSSLKKYFDPAKHLFTLELSASVRSADAADSLKKIRDILQ